MCGLFINGPYALITTAVSSDLVSHLKCNKFTNNIKYMYM